MQIVFIGYNPIIFLIPSKGNEVKVFKKWVQFITTAHGKAKLAPT